MLWYQSIAAITASTNLEECVGAPYSLQILDLSFPAGGTIYWSPTGVYSPLYMLCLNKHVLTIGVYEP